MILEFVPIAAMLILAEAVPLFCEPCLKHCLMWYGEQLAHMNVNPLGFSLKRASDVSSSRWYKKVMMFCSLVLLCGLIPFWSYHKHFYRQHVSDYPLNGVLGSYVPLYWTEVYLLSPTLPPFFPSVQ